MATKKTSRNSEADMLAREIFIRQARVKASFTPETLANECYDLADGFYATRDKRRSPTVTAGSIAIEHDGLNDSDTAALTQPAAV
ncbi:hypothetical protein LCGC14_0583350 [marine sediment metagenome]|uniref:Uncharacterized protein n=1 Tax=marine sediment metagenome TaxID=412755 RepID=A0A0F9RFS0_9ZZZZ